MEQALPEPKNSMRVSDLRAARTVFVQTLGLNLLVSISKLVCGFATNTLSMIADGFHSFLDASSNIVGIIGLTISIKPPDAGHPYGHRKFEAIAYAVESALQQAHEGIMDVVVHIEEQKTESSKAASELSI